MKLRLRVFGGLVLSLAILILGQHPLWAEQSRTLNLEECIAIALEHNTDAVVAKKSMASAKARVLGAVSNFLPSLDANASFSHSVQSFRDPLSGITVDGVTIPERFLERKSDSYSAGVNLRQTIFGGGYNFSNLSYARAGHRGAQNGYQQTRQLVTLEVKIRYYDLLRAKRLLQVAEELVHSSEEQVKREESLMEIGASTKAYLLRAKVKLGEDRLGLISAQNNLSIAKANLNDILGWDLETELEVVEDLTTEQFSLDFDDLAETALAVNPSVKMAQEDVQQSEATLGMAKSGRLPNLSASGGYSWYDSDLPEDAGDWRDHDSWNVGLSLNLPLFDGFSTKSNINQAKLGQAVSEENLQQSKRDVTLAVKQAFLNVTEAEKRMQVAGESLALAEEERRLIEERYRLGASFLLELIDSQVAYTTAQTNHISALYDYQLALAQLEQAVGIVITP